MAPASEIRCTSLYIFVCIFQGESVSFIRFPKVLSPTFLRLYHVVSLEVVAFELGLKDWAGLHEVGFSGVEMKKAS